eukprot:TRINITY_DN51256_c0_g1_i2.p1 TRINITY_DN51256_c0_g1~~TRINITY_DN51256_c0_g1_i2.p1  ORF type:complete len:223 (-),score=37.92 TRINITY_DN51256_c0_g1_i2:98-766(-)
MLRSLVGSEMCIRDRDDPATNNGRPAASQSYDALLDPVNWGLPPRREQQRQHPAEPRRTEQTAPPGPALSEPLHHGAHRRSAWEKPGIGHGTQPDSLEQPDPLDRRFEAWYAQQQPPPMHTHGVHATQPMPMQQRQLVHHGGRSPPLSGSVQFMPPSPPSSSSRSGSQSPYTIPVASRQSKLHELMDTLPRSPLLANQVLPPVSPSDLHPCLLYTSPSPRDS